MPVLLLQIDAFTSQPFCGNPAAVCLLPEAKSAEWMQSVAAEMNLSETAFLVRQTDGYDLRWFTPRVEVDLCGHATLASAHALWTEGHLAADETARFHTKSGLLTCTRDESWIEMDFPARPNEEVPAPAGLLEALGVDAVFVGRNADDYLVEVESPDVVYNLSPDFGRLAQVKTRGTVVTSRAAHGDKFDFVSRMFAPAVGINEDPVTGSAHCALAPHWAQKLGKEQMTGYQASARRGIVRVNLKGNRVLLGGQATTVLRGELLA